MKLDTPSLKTASASVTTKACNPIAVSESQIDGLMALPQSGGRSAQLHNVELNSAARCYSSNSSTVTTASWAYSDNDPLIPQVSTAPALETMSAGLKSGVFASSYAVDIALAGPNLEAYGCPLSRTSVGADFGPSPSVLSSTSVTVHDSAFSPERRLSLEQAPSQSAEGMRLDALLPFGHAIASQQYASDQDQTMIFGDAGIQSNQHASNLFEQAMLPFWTGQTFTASTEPPSVSDEITSWDLVADVAKSTPKAVVKQRRRPPRQHTSREEATFQCVIRGCGKFFSRSYNFKSHMETHDEKREYPFPCAIDGCAKKFVRKTDLQRHHQSVHAKERNHRCDFCDRLFARKDTLRRHMEDGCAKRFDVDRIDLRARAGMRTSAARRVRRGDTEFAPKNRARASPLRKPPPMPGDLGLSFEKVAQA